MPRDQDLRGSRRTLKRILVIMSILATSSLTRAIVLVCPTLLTDETDHATAIDRATVARATPCFATTAFSASASG